MKVISKFCKLLGKMASSAGPSDKEVHEAHMRSGYQPNIDSASKGEFLLPPDHEMSPEEVEAYKSECVSESTRELKEDEKTHCHCMLCKKMSEIHGVCNCLFCVEIDINIQNTFSKLHAAFLGMDTRQYENKQESTKEDTKKCYCNACYVGYECHCSTVESTKKDHDKCKLDIINPAYLEDLADVLTDGEEVYGLNNWKGLHFSRIIASMLRHMTAIQKGEDIDPDSGHPHATHIAANAMFLHWWQANGFVKGKQDDRRWANK